MGVAVGPEVRRATGTETRETAEARGAPELAGRAEDA